jgi:hypothetical protein
LDTPGKKTAAAIHQEVAREVDSLLQRIFAERRRTGGLDLEAVEMAFRTTMHQAGAAGLTQLLTEEPPQQRHLPCACGGTADYQELRSKPVLTAVGPARMLRPYYLCSRCHEGQIPTDQALDVEKTEFSPGVRRMLGVVGSECSSFRLGAEQLLLLAGVEVTAKAVERVAEAIGADIAAREQAEIQKALQLELPAAGPPIPVLCVELDGTGVPVVAKETEGREGREEGQPPRTREAKMGCVFTQTMVDEEGYAVRDEASTTYLGGIQTSGEFGRALYTEAYRRGWSRAVHRVVLADGQHYNWNIAQEHFPGAVQIVDLYHAREHVWELGAKLYPSDKVAKAGWIKTHQRWLDDGQIENLVASLRSISCERPELGDHIRTEANYFEANAERMRYPRFRSRGFFVGTGVMEAACKTIIGGRLKRSGMFWTVRGANSIIALRCCRLSGNFEDYWERRRT